MNAIDAFAHPRVRLAPFEFRPRFTAIASTPSRGPPAHRGREAAAENDWIDEFEWRPSDIEEISSLQNPTGEWLGFALGLYWRPIILILGINCLPSFLQSSIVSNFATIDRIEKIATLCVLSVKIWFTSCLPMRKFLHCSTSKGSQLQIRSLARA